MRTAEEIQTPSQQSVPLPRFLHPDPPTVPNSPDLPNGPNDSLAEDGVSDWPGGPIGRESSVPRTPISTIGKPKAAEVTALVAGLLGVVVVVAAWAVKARTGRKLRKPTNTQTDDVAAPLGRILMRHADLALLGPDLGDLIAAGAATGAYLSDGPLLEGTARGYDEGIPDNLQEATP